jgi:hypothetical protein
MNWVDGHDKFIGQLIEGKKMHKFNYYIYTKFTEVVEVEAETKEEAEEKIWEMYNEGAVDPLSSVDADVETNLEYNGKDL